MLEFNENVKCKDCGDSVECRLCSIVVGQLRGSKVLRCEKIDVAKNLKRAMGISRAELRRNVNLDQQKLF